MTFKELNDKFSELDVFNTKTEAKETLAYLLTIITDEVKAGGSVALGQSFGTFKAATQAKSSGTMNGKAWTSPAKQVIKFSPSGPMKLTIAGN